MVAVYPLGSWVDVEDNVCIIHTVSGDIFSGGGETFE